MHLVMVEVHYKHGEIHYKQVWLTEISIVLFGQDEWQVFNLGL